MGYGERPHIEDAHCLDLLQLLRRGLIAPGFVTHGQVAGTTFRADLDDAAGVLLLGAAEHARCTIQLSTTPNHFGGRNWFMHCPRTERRARKLYRWPGMTQFVHRTAVWPLPIYACSREGAFDRILEKRRALRRKLGDDTGDLSAVLFRPKWMRWATYEAIIARDRVLAELQYRILLGGHADNGEVRQPIQVRP